MPPAFHPALSRCLQIFALTLLSASLSSQAARLPREEVSQLKAARDAGDIATVEAAMSTIHERYRRGEVDDELESRAVDSLASADPGLAKFYTQWVAAYPKSYMARTVLARHYVESGFRARGTAWARETPPEQMEAMRRLHRKARVELEAALSLTDKPVSALAEMIGVAMTIGTEDERKTALDRALTLDRKAFAPRHFYLYAAQPSWGGSLSKMRETINASRGVIDAEQMRKFEIILRDEERFPVFVKGIALVEQDKYQEGIVALTPLLEKEDYVRGYISRGNAYSMLKMWDLALKDLQKALELDPDRVCCKGMLGSLAKAQLENRLITEGMANLIQSAEEDHTWSINTLAVVYAFGRHGQKQDLVQAKRWCERASHLGNSLAMFCLGTLLHSGQGTKRDPEKGIYWLGRSADLGENDARADLAFILWNGEGVKKDRERALDLWIAAARAGHARSIGQLRSRLTTWEYRLKVDYAGFFEKAFPKDGGRAWWMMAIQWASWVAFMGVAMFWLGWARRRADQSVPPGTLQHPVSTLIVGILGAAFFFGIAIVSNLFPNSTVTIFTDLVFCGFGLMFSLILVDYFTVRHKFNEKGMRFARLLRGKDQFAWKQVTSVRYSGGMGWFVIKTHDGKTARISTLMAGLPYFARTVLAQVPKSAFDEATQTILFETMRGNAPVTAP